MRWKIVTWITVRATKMSSVLIRKREQPYHFSTYSKMPKGSLGRTYYDTLVNANLNYEPNLLRHDLKHILLGYAMRMPDELRIHAFLIGNRSYNPMAILYLTICLMIVPEMIFKLKHDFRRGKSSAELKKINLTLYLHEDLENCRKKLGIKAL